MFWLLASVLLIPGCGFHPLYAQPNQQESSFLSSLTIAPIPGRIGQQLTTELEDSLRVVNQPYAKYRVEVTLDKQDQPVVIEQDRQITRRNVTLGGKIKLVEQGTGKVVYEDTLRSFSGYSKADSEFATFIGERDATGRAVTQLAEEIRLRLIAWGERNKS